MHRHLPPHTRGQRIGIYGGSFNPPHSGHVHVALSALQRLKLDAVWVLVSPQNPLKPLHAPPSLERAQALKEILHHPRVHILTLEDEWNTRYSIDTVRSLRDHAPDIKFVWIMGADNLCNFHLWQEWSTLARLMPIAIVDRPSYSLRALHSPAALKFAKNRIAEAHAPRLATMKAPAWVLLHGPLQAISSTALRRLLAP